MRLKDAEWRIEATRDGEGTNYRMVLSGDPWMTHYMLTLMPGAISLMWLVLVIAKFRRGDSDFQPVVIFELVFGCLSLLAWKAKWHDLQFKRYATQSDPISNCNVIRAFAEFHGWEVQRDDEASLLQIGIPKAQSWGTEGEVLTVFFRGSEVFVNCMPYPDGRSTAPSAWTPAKRRMRTVAEAVGGTEL